MAKISESSDNELKNNCIICYGVLWEKHTIFPLKITNVNRVMSEKSYNLY
jgi:hypothetical protein